MKFYIIYIALLALLFATQKPAVQQILLNLKKYMADEKFNPRLELTAEQIKKKKKLTIN